MNRNVQLLEKVMQHIDDHPEQHDQSTWVRTDCGTAACFAGWAAILTFGTGIILRDGGFQCPPPYAHRIMSEVAADLLGLDEANADTLFHACNSRGMLRLMVKDLVNGDELGAFDDYEQEAYS